MSAAIVNPIQVRGVLATAAALDLEIWHGAPIRVPLELLEDAARHRLRLDQLRDLIFLWITERPNDPVPSTVSEFVGNVAGCL
jgi:hypothetical protein